MSKAWFLENFFSLYPHLPPPKFLLLFIGFPFNLDNHYQAFQDLKSYIPNHVRVSLPT